MKKTIALFLAVLMCLSVFAGCAKPQQPETTGDTAADTTAAETTPETTGETEAPQALETITVLCPASFDHPNPFFNYTKNPRWEQIPLIKEFYGVLADNGLALEFEAIEITQYNEAVKTRLMTGVDLPDIVVDPALTDVEAVQLGEAGIVADVLDLMEKHDADGSIQAYWDKVVGPWMSTITTENGQQFWMPYTFRSTYVNADGTPADALFDTTHHVAIREDWLKALGKEYQMFYTPDELADVLIEMHDKDCNGNGVQDEVLGNFHDLLETGFEPGFGMGQGLVTVRNDGQGVVCNLYADGFGDYIAFLQKLYNAGAIDTTVLNGTNVRAANRGSTINSYSTEGWEEAAIIGYETTAVYSPVILDDDKGANGAALPIVDNCRMVLQKWFINANTQHPEAVIKLFDLLYTDKYAEMSTWGTEGVHYNTDENGIKREVPGAWSPDPNTPAELLTTRVLAYALPNVLDRVRFHGPLPCPIEGYEHKYEAEWWGREHSTEIVFQEMIPPYAMPTQAELDVLAARETTLKTYIQEMILGLVTGEKSMDDYPTYLEELKELGLDEYVATFAARHQRFLDAAAAIGAETVYN